MKGQIYVLKRSNGFIGIYVNGHKQENLKSNFPITDRSSSLFDSIMREFKDQAHNHNTICEIIFTEDEENFKSGLPSFTDYLGSITDLIKDI
jgi:hypothetical protein